MMLGNQNNTAEMTRYAFMSHMEDYIKQLLTDPLKAKTDTFLHEYGIDEPKALTMLLKRTDPSDEMSAVLIRTERIRPEELSEEDEKNGVVPKDKFHIRYKLPRKDYKQKMRNLYIDMFESNIVCGDDKKLNEWYFGGEVLSDKDALDVVNDNLSTVKKGSDNERKLRVMKKKLEKKMNISECEGGDAGLGGATGCEGSTGQYTAPLFGGKPIRKRIVKMTNEQFDYIKKRLTEEAVMDSTIGNFGYDAPPFKKKKDPAYDHKNMFKKGWSGNEQV